MEWNQVANPANAIPIHTVSETDRRYIPEHVAKGVPGPETLAGHQDSLQQSIEEAIVKLSHFAEVMEFPPMPAVLLPGQTGDHESYVDDLISQAIALRCRVEGMFPVLDHAIRQAKRIRG